MTLSVSVLVPLGEPDPAIVDFVRAIDLQSLPSSAYETVFVSADDAMSERLERLQVHRPNIVIHRSDSNDVAALVETVSEVATGEYVLVLEPGHLLLPESLERLYQAAVDGHLDLVVGRPAGRVLGGSDPEHVSFDRGGLESAEARNLLASPAILVRRELLTTMDSGIATATSWRELVAKLLDQSPAVGVQGSYPALRVASAIPLGLDSAVGVSPSRSVLSWVDGRLRFETADSAVVGQSRVVLRHGSGLEFYSPLRSAQEAIDVDIRDAAAGAPLAPGLWTVAIREVDSGSGKSEDRLVAAGSLGGCLVDDVLVLPARNEDEVLVLDVGATKTPLSPTPSQSDSAIRDNVQGALLQLELPGLAVAGRGSMSGHVFVKSLALPARLVSDGSTARIECYVSGLAGSYPLALKFGRPKSPTKLNLVFSGTGDISVITRPKAKPRPAPSSTTSKSPAPKRSAGATITGAKKPGAKKAGAKKAAAPPARGLAKIRRHLPKSLEPAIKGLRRNPVARAVYRRLSGL